MIRDRILHTDKQAGSSFSEVRKFILYVLTAALFHTGLLRVFNAIINMFQRDEVESVLGRWGLPTKRARRNLQILTYHRVNDEGDIYFPATRIGVFDRQMRYLSKNFNVLPLEEAVERMANSDLGENTMVVTLDDGYRDNFVNAFPVLKKYGLPTTIFLASGVIGNGGLLWHDRVFSAFRSTRTPVMEDPAGSGKVYALRSSEERIVALRATLRWLRTLPETGRQEAIFALEEALETGEQDAEEAIMLRWEEIRHMQNHRVTFGSHTQTHPILSALPEQTAREEICHSKELIEKQIGIPVKAFAYPNGTENDFDETSIRILKDAGFTCAVTTIFGTNTCGDDLFRLKRGNPWEESLPVFAAKMNWYKLLT
jgi:peptidoglycan/xylan/chitin deacetylase (PgdA/CDA1 family)